MMTGEERWSNKAKWRERSGFMGRRGKKGKTDRQYRQIATCR